MTFLLKYLRPMNSLSRSLFFGSLLFLAMWIFWVTTHWGYAQDFSSSAEVVKAQEKLKEDLISLQGEIKRLDSAKAITLTQLRLLNAQETIQDSLVTIIQQDSIRLGNKLDALLKEEQETLEQYKRLKGNCADAVRMAYRYRVSQTRSMYILSSTSFDDVFQRYRFMGNLTRVLNYKMRALKDIQSHLILVRNDVTEQLTQIEEKGQELYKEKETLSTTRKKYSAMLDSLKNDAIRQQEIKLDIEANIRALDIRLKEILEEEARIQAQKRANMSSPDARYDELATSFAANEGRFPFPVRRGRIVTGFGQQDHPDIPSIKIQNNGVDIETQPGEEVRVLFEGKVSRVFEMPNIHWTVLVQHGSYFTVYSNLMRPLVSNGQELSSGQVIGNVFDDGSSAVLPRLHFEIWQNTKKLDPEQWIRR